MSSPLVDPDTLAHSLDGVKLFDVRWRLGDPDWGRTAYLEGHLPDAIFVDLDRDLASAPGSRWRHPLPDPATFQDTLGRLGIGADDTVVVYDGSSGTVAARMWWMLKANGHREVAVLDGGVEAWIDSGRSLQSGDVEPDPAVYPGPITFAGAVDIDSLAGRQLVDVRAPERYWGEYEPIDPRPGHIPGAANIPTSLSLDGHRFAKPEVLAHLFSGLEEPVVSCGSGVNACHTALAMVIAGLQMPDVYIGSYSEWSRSDRHVSTNTGRD